MKKIDEITEPKSCLNRAEEDEPLFVLRANDPTAPALIREWADRYQLRKIQSNNNDLTEAQRAKYAEALKIADEMDDWRELHN